MVTSQEFRSLTSWIANVELKFDGSDDDEFLWGYVQAHQDMANSLVPRKRDKFAVMEMRNQSYWRGVGYEAGVQAARAKLQEIKVAEGNHGRFPRCGGFNCMENFGRHR